MASKPFVLGLVDQSCELRGGLLPVEADLGEVDVAQVLSLPEEQWVLDGSWARPSGLFWSVFTLHSNLKVINRELSLTIK